MHRRAIAILVLGACASVLTGCMTAFAAFQPEDIGGETVVITTFDDEGKAYERVLTPIDDGGQLVVAANHWPRAWYFRALQNPDVRIERGGEVADYRAVPVSEEERERLLGESNFPVFLYVFTGFAPREFLHLEPR